MQFKKTLEIKANHKQVVINVADILYTLCTETG